MKFSAFVFIQQYWTDDFKQNTSIFLLEKITQNTESIVVYGYSERYFYSSS